MDAPERFGRYRVKDILAIGGMAEVFRCELEGIGGFRKTVVVKRIRPQLARDQKCVDMLLDEARLAANLNHPNINQIFEIDESNGSPYIAMMNVRGLNLADILTRWRAQGVVPVGYLVTVVSDACSWWCPAATVLKFHDFSRAVADSAHFSALPNFACMLRLYGA